MAFYGIDVSEWQGDINWSSVNADFAVLRAGYGRYAAQEDKKFKANYSGCKDYHIPCGVYWYSYALTAEDAVREAAKKGGLGYQSFVVLSLNKPQG